MSQYYIGIMSGTSADGIDVALVDCTNSRPLILAHHHEPYPPTLREAILALCHPGPDEIRRMGELDVRLGRLFAEVVLALLQREGYSKNAIKAIGSHGQTIRHAPYSACPFTLQIGDPNTIAMLTGITTVADFRRKDVALGGQGAPLVPAFHRAVFHDDQHDRAIVNIGGIANVTLLPRDAFKCIIGFDSGPGNTLLDLWIFDHQQVLYDDSGQYAAQGKIQTELLKRFLDDPYFKLVGPKSTGREYFNREWLTKKLEQNEYLPTDVQATLVELTARSIFDSIHMHMTGGEILICGGGAYNDYLVMRLSTLAQPIFSVHTTDQLGINPNRVEAVAFAWLAKQTLTKQTSNLPSVTGASQAAILGGIYTFP